MAAKAGKTTLMSLWKQGWNEIPEVMGSGFYGLMGIGFAFYGWHTYFRDEKYNHRYKTVYTVYRPNDERVARIRSHEDSPQPTKTPATSYGC